MYYMRDSGHISFLNLASKYIFSCFAKLLSEVRKCMSVYQENRRETGKIHFPVNIPVASTQIYGNLLESTISKVSTIIIETCSTMIQKVVWFVIHYA